MCHDVVSPTFDHAGRNFCQPLEPLLLAFMDILRKVTRNESSLKCPGFSKSLIALSSTIDHNKGGVDSINQHVQPFSIYSAPLSSLYMRVCCESRLH